MRSDLLLWENPAFLTRVDEWVLSGRPDQHSIDWNPAPWVKEFPEHAEFLNDLHIKYLGFLNRDTVKITVHEESENSHYINGFLAVMIWGYAGDPRGPHRTNKVLSQDNASSSIVKAYAALLNNDVKAAYSALVKEGPKYLGPAFATKYLYFASHKNVSPTPLILDSLVTVGLARWGNKSYNAITASAKDYLEYLEYMKFAADETGLSEQNLEFLVFSETAKLKGNQSWSNRTSVANMSETETRAWALLLTAEILLRDSNLVAYYSQPGGGQYDCVSIREFEPRTGLKADFNIQGSIRFHQPYANYYSWDALVSRGVSGMCEMLAEVYGWDCAVNLENASTWAKSFRAMASLAINSASDASTKYECLTIDNSTYGLSVDSNIFKEFIAAGEAKSNHPNLLQLPKEAWFWKVVTKDQVVSLIDTYSGQQYFEAKEVQGLNWPK